MANYSTAQILAMEPRARRSPRDAPGIWELCSGGSGGPCLAGEHRELPNVGAGAGGWEMEDGRWEMGLEMGDGR